VLERYKAQCAPIVSNMQHSCANRSYVAYYGLKALISAYAAKAGTGSPNPGQIDGRTDMSYVMAVPS